MTDIRAGDVVVCVDASPRGGTHPVVIHALRRFVVGKSYRVASVNWACWPDDGWAPVFDIAGVPYPARPGEVPGWHPDRFRKIDAADEQFTARIRKCRPVPTKVEETALDRLAARLGEGRIKQNFIMEKAMPTEAERSLIYSEAIFTLPFALPRQDPDQDRGEAHSGADDAFGGEG